jgi:hypothetical protein
METKLFEVRDTRTLMVVMATRLHLSDFKKGTQDYRILQRMGWSNDQEAIYLIHPVMNLSSYSPYDWKEKSLKEAHEHMYENWANLESGQVICCEFNRNERKTCTPSDLNQDY